MSTIAALAYAGLASSAIGVQIALAAGAPLGALSLGGAWPGRLPLRLRPVAVLQAGLLSAMALAVLSRAGVVTTGLPDWSYPAAMALTVLTTISNTITPSKPERHLWAPVTAGMLVTGLIAGIL